MYTTVIIEDDPMITRLNRRYIEQDAGLPSCRRFRRRTGAVLARRNRST